MFPKSFLAFLLILCATSPVHAQEDPFSRMDVFDLQWVADPQISPDGDQVVYVRRSMDKLTDRRTSRLWLIRSDGSGHRKLTHRDVNESTPRWSPDGTKIAFISTAEKRGSQIFVYGLETGAVASITQVERTPRGIAWSPDGSRIAFSMLVPEENPVLVDPPAKPEGAEWADPPRVTTRLNYQSDGTGYVEPGFSHLFVVSAEGGPARQVTTGDYHHDGPPTWTRDGSALIFSANRHEDWTHERRNTEIHSVSVGNGTIRQLTDRWGPDHSPRVSADGSRIAYLGYDDQVQTYQVTRLYVMNLDGSAKREITTTLDRSISDISWDEEGEGLYIQYDDQGNTKVGHTDLSGNSSIVAHDGGGTSVGRPYGGGSFSVSTTGKIAMNQTTPYHPAELAVGEKGDAEGVQKITGLSEDLLGRKKLGRVEEVWYTSSVDGRDLHGWIVKPPSYESERTYPLLVENHGGPISNYGDRFSPEVQLYASAGFLVFYPNPRGSTSYGEEFGNLLYHDYPGDDYRDVMDGVDFLIEEGYVSEDSLFVTGGSAGGIMTAWIIGKNNRFRAAAVQKPVMNWISKTLTADNYYGYAYYRYPGQPWENFEEYWRFSPISLVGNVETPTLVIVGTEDRRTPLSEGKQLYHALKLRKIETALVEVPGAAHFISNRPSQLITKVDHITAWFARYR